MSIQFTRKPEFDANNFTQSNNYEAWLHSENMDIGGGKLTKDDIDSLNDYPQLTRISISGLDQSTFEYFILNYAQRYEAIYFFKNKFISDLSPLETLENIRVLGFFFNQRAVKLWDMGKNTQLEMLNLDDLSRLKTLEGIEKAPALKYLDFGNKVWGYPKMDIIPNLENTPLEWVYYNAQLSYENAYKFLQAPKMKSLTFPTNMYKTEFLAWICANYPHIEGGCLCPYVIFNEESGTICGKRKPHIDPRSEKDMKKAEKSAESFEKMKTEFKGMGFDEILRLLIQ